MIFGLLLGSVWSLKCCCGGPWTAFLGSLGAHGCPKIKIPFFLKGILICGVLLASLVPLSVPWAPGSLAPASPPLPLPWAHPPWLGAWSRWPSVLGPCSVLWGSALSPWGRGFPASCRWLRLRRCLLRLGWVPWVALVLAVGVLRSLGRRWVGPALLPVWGLVLGCLGFAPTCRAVRRRCKHRSLLV